MLAIFFYGAIKSDLNAKTIIGLSVLGEDWLKCRCKNNIGT